MGFWQTFCTCAGCVAGAVCIIATGGTATPLVVATIGGGIAGNLIGSKVDNEEKKVKNQAKDLEIRGQTIETLKKDNEKLHSEVSEKDKKLKEIDNKIEKRGKEIEEITREIKDPNTSEEKRQKLKKRLAVLLAQQEDDKKERDDIIKTIKQLNDRIKDNNKNISSVGSGGGDKDKKGIMAFLTLENILICLAIYAVYQIAIKDDRR
ncbi:hypothetical protein [endosymbiont GvMRE of Glomus versiforme]|uniref:hypothetical protein n=1 Tax=endosymbiont GvMRE of Glomus versiforme TaxID=2039283 RepID=UPI000ECB0A95|nr:hypothetical protein [endosymbiont GvMRE of Glomus versiforme]RHZ36527.1 hypothetical protein GvMRE_I2g228 [endosymbiont GvMRE of Glomus versiforme]